MPTFSSALLPTTNGLTFGSAALRWSCFVQDVDVAGTTTVTGRFSVKNLEDIRFADQYAGTVTQMLDGAITDVVTGLVVAPSTMGAGSPTSLNSSQYLLDLRSGVFKLYCGNTSTPQLNVTSGGVAAQVFTGSNANPAAAGLMRLSKIDALNFRNNANGADVNGLSLDGSDIVQVGGAAGAKTIGPMAFSGALTGITNLAYSGQITSSVAVGTAPFVVTSTTVVPNLNVAALNGVTVSGAAASGQALIATSASAAGWSAISNSYKSESVQYTPVTKSNTAANQTYMSFAVPANEIAVGQALRITCTGTLSNATGGPVIYTPILKLGATTWLTGPVQSVATGAGGSWGLVFMVICTAAGSSGTMEVQLIDGQMAGLLTLFAGNSVTKAFDTTSLQTLNFTATMDTAAALATMTQRQMVIERIG